MIGATQINLNSGTNDDGGALAAWPFPFYVYNSGYGLTNNLTMNTNGYMRFDAPISISNNIPIPSSTFGQFLSYGGNTDGAIFGNIMQKVTGSSPNRIWTIAFTYNTHYLGSTYGYQADIQVSFYETSNEIRIGYHNVTTGSSSASNLGINAGDNIYYNVIPTFPTSDTCYTFTPSTALAITDPTNFTQTVVSGSQINLGWTKNTNSDDVIVVYNTVNNFAAPVNGVSYSVGNQISPGQGIVFYKGSATGYNQTGLTPNTTYYYKIYSYNNIPMYSSGVFGSATTTPINNPTNLNSNAVSSSQIDLTWTPSGGNNVMIAYNTSNTFATPINGIAYVVGNQIAAGQGTLIYSGSGTSFSHTGLSSGTHYYKAWSYDGSHYYSLGVITNATTNSVVDPSNLTTNALSTSQINLTWSKNATNQDVMIVRHTNSNFPIPTNGYTYWVGAMLSANLEKVVYMGSATSFTDTGLTTSTNYCYKVFSYDANHYYSSGISACDTTMSPGLITFPYFQDFETTVAVGGSPVCNAIHFLNIDWINSTTDDIDWVPRTGGTPSGQTGPNGDHTSGSGNYLYTEASNGCYGYNADLISPLLNFANLSNPKMEIFYHMYGANMGSLSVQVSTNGGTSWSANIWSQTGQQNTTQGSAYNQAQISLAAYAGLGNIKIRIRGTTGSQYASDMAIDDIKIYQSVPMTYASSTCFQNTEAVFHGIAQQEIMQIMVVTNGDQNPLTATQFMISTAGTTSLGDIANIKLWYTGASSNFATTNQFGSTVIIPSASFPISGSQVLFQDTNYFWLTYDIPTSANYNGIVDACCSQITIASSNKIPTITCPIGDKSIKGYQIVGTGTSTDNTMPIHYDLTAASEFIYASTEMGSAKDITKLAFYKGSGNNTTQEPQNVSIYMKNTSISTLASGSYSLTGYTLVYNGAFPNNATSGWMEISLITPFTYDGTSNLEVLVSQTIGPNFQTFQAPNWRYSTVTGGNRCRYNSTTSTTASPASLSLASSDRLPNIRLEYVLPTLMEYISSTAIHPDTNGVSPGTATEKILQIEVVTSNSINPLKVKGFTLNTTGTTSLADIQNAKIYYTGANSTFSTTNQFSATIAAPGGTLTFANDSVTLAPGTNYFWLTYDIKSTATLNNYIDAQCTSIIVDDTARTPIITSPVGKKQIRNYVIVGTGTLENTGTQDGSPYANYYWGAKNQFLITAADLISAGVGTGAINSLAFDVTNVNACPALDNFTIKLKNTTSTSLSTSWETGATTVYTIGSYQPVLGWNTHTFSTPFIWDGVSNILVETCFNNSSYVNNGNASISQTNTSSTATHYYRFDNTNVCSSVANSGTSARKPNIKFDCALPTPMSYVSSKALHSDTTGVLQGGSNQEIIGIEIITTGNGTPLNATSFSISTNGTTNISDISNARIWYTGLDSNFSAINQFGATVPAPASTNNFVGTQALVNGKNYFWLTYNISSTAALGNYVDAECTSINVGGVKIPTITAPIGRRMIAGALSGTYTIGSGGDYPTFSAAANALNTFGISGAVTFNVISGTYTDQIILYAITGASSTNTITFQSQSGDSSNVILQFASNATNNFVLKLDGTDYCTFKNMTIKSIGTAYGTVVGITNNSDWNTFTNNQIISTANAAANGAGIYFSGAGGANDNHITNNYINVVGDYGVYMQGSGTTTLQAGTEIENNVIMHGRYGVYAYYQNAIKINSNIISQPISPSSGYYYGIYLYYCDNSSEITKNKIDVKGVNSYVYGIFLGNSDGTATNRALVANNFISVNTGGYPRGIYVLASNYINIFNNNINLTTGGNNGRAFYLPSGGNINLTNNNIINTGGGYAVYTTNTTTIASSNYNNLYTSGGTLGYWGQNRNTLAQWQSGSNMDANSISVNPSYYSATDLHVTNFSMDKLGTPITVITDDIDGEVRHATTPDIGADEFQANYEISVEAITAPSSTICGGNENVTITIKNNGAITITSLSINWSVNSVGQTSYNWTGSLASNDSASVIIGNYNFTTGSNLILVQTLSPNGQNDQVQANDTMSLNVTAYGYPNANAGTDTSVCSTSTHTITSATASSYLTLAWSTSGSGSFTNGTTLNPTYTPSNADTASGIVYLTLTANGYPTCGTDTNSMALTFLNSPNATISGLASNYCQNAGTATLIGSPAGGTFNGLGMSGNVFNPAVAGAGTHSITYLATNSMGCSGSTSQQTTVFPLTTVSIGGLNTSYCVNASTVNQTPTPFGGTLTGNGIVGTTFIPSVAGVGTHIITYSYTDANSCSYVVTESVTVNALPSVSFSGLAASYCMSASAVTLIGSPSGGTFSGAGISGNTFNPATANAGTHSITYTYQDANSCINSYSQNVTVNANPSVSFSGLQTSYCANAGIVSLIGTPSGGSFSGTGMTGGTFNPTAAGTGTHSITYSYTNVNGCAGADMQNVIIYSLPVANAGNYDSVTYLGFYNLTGSATGGTGNYNYSWSPASLIAGNPNVQSPTTDTMHVTTLFTLTVVDTVSGCQDNDQVTIKVTGGPLSANASAIPDSICEGDTTQLTALASGGTGSYSYSWSSNPGSFTSTLANPIVNPTVTTTYSVTVTSGVQTFNSSVTIIVVPIPTVSFSGLAASYCDGAMNSTLVGTPSGGYFVGNGVTGSTFNPTVAGAGTHSISYTYANSFGCSAMSVQNTTVNALPTVAISGPDSVFYNTDTVLIGSVSGGSSNYSYSWSPASLINGSTTQQNCTTIAITSQVILTLTVTDNVTGCIATNVDTIFPYGGPLSCIASASPNNICQGATSQLNITALGGTGTYSYSWSSNPVGFSSSSQNPVVAPSVTTTYTASVSDGVSSPVLSTVIVNVIPAPTVSFSGLASIYCASQAADTLIGIPAGGTFTGPGITGNLFDPAVAGQGSHTITYTYIDGFGCTGVDMQGVNVSAAPTASAGNEITLPCGAVGQVIGSASVLGMVYSWSPTAGLSNPNISNPAASPALTTLYTLTVLDTISGCSATDDILIIVTGGPTAIASADTTICYGSTVTLNASGGVTYLWSTNATSSSIIATPTVSTTYYVTVYDGSGCGDSDTINITVNNPSVDLGNDTVIPVGQSLVLDAGPGFASYIWSNSLTSQTITVTTAGTYSVTVTDNIGCTGNDAIVVTFNVGLNDLNNYINLRLFPNPTKGLITISISDYSGNNLSYEITDITGRFISREKLKIVNNSVIHDLDLSIYPKGVYFIRFKDDYLNRTEKIIIQ